MSSRWVPLQLKYYLMSQPHVVSMPSTQVLWSSLKKANNFNLENNYLIFQIDLPEKFNATLFRFITSAAPKVPWPMLFKCSPKSRPNNDTNDWLNIYEIFWSELYLYQKKLRYVCCPVLTLVKATPTTTIHPHPPSGNEKSFVVMSFWPLL